MLTSRVHSRSREGSTSSHSHPMYHVFSAPNLQPDIINPNRPPLIPRSVITHRNNHKRMTITSYHHPPPNPRPPIHALHLRGTPTLCVVHLHRHARRPRPSSPRRSDPRPAIDTGAVWDEDVGLRNCGCCASCVGVGARVVGC
jgi:hypothetical protein